jgi:hypothetical protein
MPFIDEVKLVKVALPKVLIICPCTCTASAHVLYNILLLLYSNYSPNILSKEREGLKEN